VGWKICDWEDAKVFSEVTSTGVAPDPSSRDLILRYFEGDIGSKSRVASRLGKNEPRLGLMENPLL